ncbi:MAG: DUF3717 domain-containing protein [Brachymonas sp.]|jgi:predicted Fe-S protein YdhL (DUF1289 family)
MTPPHVLSEQEAQQVARIHITDIEAALNWLRVQYPSADGVQLAKPLRRLAEVYALMVYHHQEWVAARGFPAEAMDSWLQWYAITPDTPCIAICSTAQGDALCKGCGRSEGEVQAWQSMNAVAKRMVWRRISQEGTAWRFNKYAERSLERQSAPHQRR